MQKNKRKVIKKEFEDAKAPKLQNKQKFFNMVLDVISEEKVTNFLRFQW